MLPPDADRESIGTTLDNHPSAVSSERDNGGVRTSQPRSYQTLPRGRPFVRVIP